MRQIWKFPLNVMPDDGTTEIAMPEGAQIIHFEPLLSGDLSAPNYHPTVWAIVDSDSPLETRRFRIFGTGHPLPRAARHVGTYFESVFVWHIFELLGEPLPEGLVLPADAEAAYRTLTGAGFVASDRKGSPAWLAPNDEPLTTEQMMAVATLQDYGFGAVVSG